MLLTLISSKSHGLDIETYPAKHQMQVIAGRNIFASSLELGMVIASLYLCVCVLGLKKGFF